MGCGDIFRAFGGSFRKVKFENLTVKNSFKQFLTVLNSQNTSLQEFLTCIFRRFKFELNANVLTCNGYKGKDLISVKNEF